MNNEGNQQNFKGILKETFISAINTYIYRNKEGNKIRIMKKEHF